MLPDKAFVYIDHSTCLPSSARPRASHEVSLLGRFDHEADGHAIRQPEGLQGEGDIPWMWI